MDGYKLYREQNLVGEVEMNREGLYYRICCRCKPTKEILRLIHRGSGGELLIGVCGPASWGFGIERWVPIKALGNGPHCFYLAEPQDVPVKFYALNHQIPLQLQDKLEQCRFAVRDGVPGLQIII